LSVGLVVPVLGQGLPPSNDDLVYSLRMEARYEPETRDLTGRQRLIWRNTSSVPIHELRFHHYLNAFANNRSTFMLESGGKLRSTEFDREGWGWIEVDSLRLTDGTDLKPHERFLAPDDGNLEDRTVATYALPQPLAPGDSVELDIEFSARLPSVFARTGAHGDYVLGGQWFPKIGVFEDAGVRGRRQPGWNCHQFHAHSEFYADFGEYDVTLDLPERYQGKVGATGRIVEEQTADGRYRVRFRQAWVHDFAWAADPDFEVLEEVLDPAVDVPEALRRSFAEKLGMPPQELEISPVTIRLLLQPSHRTQAAVHLDAAKRSLVGLGLRLGAYPYETLTVVDPAHGAEGSGGMEYPTLITAGTSVLFNYPYLQRLPVPELVILHETAHQYFQGMAASNEFEESWLDEGITTYYEMDVGQDFLVPITFLGLDLDPRMARRRAVAKGDYLAPVNTPSWEFPSASRYGDASYGRPGLTLLHLRNLLGEKTFHRALRTYFQRYRFRHPTTSDFEATVSQVAEQDLDWFFRQALRSPAVLDYSVRRAESRPLKPPRGQFWRPGEDGEERHTLDDWNETWAHGQDPDQLDERWLFESRVEVVREGSFRHPVVVELEFEDGELQHYAWNGEERWWRRTVRRRSPLVAARVDPDHLMTLDSNLLNNGLTVEKDRRPATKVAATFLFWIQSLFQALMWLT
jgi:hypothetical protein